MAGVSRLQYAPEIRLIRVMCSGRVDLEFILRAFANGMDGVFVGGCRLGECNYSTEGNYDALNTVLLAQKILEYKGINPQRLGIAFMSSGEGNIFVQKMNEFRNQVKNIGPLGEPEGLERRQLKDELRSVARLVPYIKLAKREKLGTHLKDEGEYETFFSVPEVDELLSNVPSYYIDPEKCQACMICQRRCPVDAIDGGKNKIHVIDQEVCIRCGTCLEVCPSKFGAVREIRGEPVPAAIPEEDRIIARKSKKEKNEQETLQKEGK
ncbi:MAG: hydrogenase iron-sulfur subunit [Desulfovermiculus sp.]|nr:hydrogenase iron-sulfur subunit [Desulfovermiculus sp.]